MSAGAVSSEGLTGSGGSVLRQLPPTSDLLVLVAEASVDCIVDISRALLKCLYHVTSGFPRARAPGELEAAMSLII